MTVAGLKTQGDTLKSQYDTLNSRSNAFLVKGDLDGYATDSELNSLRNAIPSATSIAAQVDSKLDDVDDTVGNLTAQVNAALASLGNSTTYVSKVNFDAAVAMLLGKIAVAGNSTSGNSLEYSLSGSDPAYVLKVKSNISGWYVARLNLVYATPMAIETSACYDVGDICLPDYGSALANFAEMLTSSANRIYQPKLVYQAPSTTYPDGVWKLAAIEFYTNPFELKANEAKEFQISALGLTGLSGYKPYVEIVKSAEVAGVITGSGI
jgi:hypothetical protein